jgi:hypothetical protein
MLGTVDAASKPLPARRKAKQSLFRIKKLPVRSKIIPVPIHREFARIIMKLHAYPGALLAITTRFKEIPCFFPVDREIGPGDRFGATASTTSQSCEIGRISLAPTVHVISMDCTPYFGLRTRFLRDSRTLAPNSRESLWPRNSVSQRWMFKQSHSTAHRGVVRDLILVRSTK